MIIDRLQHSKSYGSLGATVRAAFQYLDGFSKDAVDGRYELDGNNLYALVQTYNSAPAVEKSFESHEHYVDIQYLVSGREIMYYRESSVLKPKAPYDPVKDVTFYEDTDGYPLYLEAGNFVLFWPQDAHKPSCLWEVASPVKKVVLKLRLPFSL